MDKFKEIIMIRKPLKIIWFKNVSIWYWVPEFSYISFQGYEYKESSTLNKFREFKIYFAISWHYTLPLRYIYCPLTRYNKTYKNFKIELLEGLIQ